MKRAESQSTEIVQRDGREDLDEARERANKAERERDEARAERDEAIELLEGIPTWGPYRWRDVPDTVRLKLRGYSDQIGRLIKERDAARVFLDAEIGANVRWAAQAERDLLRRLWQRIDGEQDGDAPSAADMEDELVRLFNDMRADVERCAADENASTQEAERFRRERDEARIRGINDERERIVSCIERVIGRPVTDGGMYRADIESALNAWNDETKAERDRLARILAVEWGDESQAPEGWKAGAAGWCVYGSEGQADREVERPMTNASWEWTIYHRGGDPLAWGTAPSALEAMEAADAAREGSDG